MLHLIGNCFSQSAFMLLSVLNIQKFYLYKNENHMKIQCWVMSVFTKYMSIILEEESDGLKRRTLIDKAVRGLKNTLEVDYIYFFSLPFIYLLAPSFWCNTWLSLLVVGLWLGGRQYVIQPVFEIVEYKGNYVLLSISSLLLAVLTRWSGPWTGEVLYIVHKIY